MAGATHTLVCPFLNDDPAFAYGVEFGLLFARMGSGEGEVFGYFCIENQEQILLLASRLGWDVVEMKPWQVAPDQTFWLHIRKRADLC